MGDALSAGRMRSGKQLDILITEYFCQGGNLFAIPLSMLPGFGGVLAINPVFRG